MLCYLGEITRQNTTTAGKQQSILAQVLLPRRHSNRQAKKSLLFKSLAMQDYKTKLSTAIDANDATAIDIKYHKNYYLKNVTNVLRR